MNMVILSNQITEGVNRIDDILNQPEISESGGGNPQTHDVTFSDVSFSYSEGLQAVKNVSFHLPQGSITGLVGPSGGGKSTVAQLLLRFYETGQGSIQIGSVDIKYIPPDKLTNLISYVFQESFLFHDTVENNIRMGNTKASREEVEQAAKNACIDEVINELPHGFDTIIGEQDAYLSGGEKQRIAIARVFLRDTPIVILDEATAYADAENESKIQQAYASLAKNKTVLIIAHRLKTVERANQILIMEKGTLIGAGTHESLLAGCASYQNMVSANERRERWTIKREAAE